MTRDARPSPSAPPRAMLPKAVKLGWSIGQVAIASHMAIISVYLLFYLTDVHKLPAALAGVLVLLPRIWNIAMDPLMGALSDRTRSRWGRRRPYLLAGSLVWGAAFAAMFYIPEDFSIAQKSAWFLVTYFIVNTGLTVYHVPYSAMAPEMTRDYHERMQLIGYKEIVARIAVLGTILASPIVIGLAPDSGGGYRWLGLVVATFIVLSGLVAFFTTAQAPAIAQTPQSLGWKAQFAIFRDNRPMLQLTGVCFLTSATDAFYSALLIYFITLAVLQDASMMGVLYPLSSLTAILLTPAWNRLAARYGKREAALLAFAGVSCATLLGAMVPAAHGLLLYTFVIVFGACAAGMFLLPSIMIPDTIEHDAWKSGMRREGAIYGAMIFTQQSGMAFGAFAVGIFLSLIGYDPLAAAASADEVLGIRLGFGLGPLLLLGLAMLIVRRYTLDEQALAAMESKPGA